MGPTEIDLVGVYGSQQQVGLRSKAKRTAAEASARAYSTYQRRKRGGTSLARSRPVQQSGGGWGGGAGRTDAYGEGFLPVQEIGGGRRLRSVATALAEESRAEAAGPKEASEASCWKLGYACIRVFASLRGKFFDRAVLFLQMLLQISSGFYIFPLFYQWAGVKPLHSNNSTFDYCTSSTSNLHSQDFISIISFINAGDFRPSPLFAKVHGYKII